MSTSLEYKIWGGGGGGPTKLLGGGVRGGGRKGGGGGGGTQQNFGLGGFGLRSKPLIFLNIPFFTLKVPFHISSIDNRYPFHLQV